MKYFKWLLILVSIGVAVLSIAEIVSYLRNPESYMLGSEAMTGNGGFYYKSKLFFMLINSAQITFSILATILFLKAEGTAGIAIAVFLVFLQILIFVIT